MKQPLSEQLRPRNLSDFYGQESIVGEGGWIQSTITSARPLSVLFWGPPGCGKTTLARIYMQSFSVHSVNFHPATHGVADLKKLIGDREDHPLQTRIDDYNTTINNSLANLSNSLLLSGLYNIIVI
jgi:putative ATPase